MSAMVMGSLTEMIPKKMSLFIKLQLKEITQRSTYGVLEMRKLLSLMSWKARKVLKLLM